MPHVRIFSFAAASLVGALFTLGADAASALTVNASGNATVQSGGPRTGANGLRFFNVEGGGSGSFASFGVADFVLAAQGASTVNGLALALTESNAAFTTPGGLNFFLVTDATTSITAGSSPLAFNAASLPDGLGSQLGTRYLVGTGTFASTGKANSGQVDSYTLSLTGSAQVLVNSVVTSGGVLRLVVAPVDATVAATFAGYANTQYAGPLLNLNVSAVPEADTAAMLLAGLGCLALLKRRRPAAR